ncbi:MAG: BTAD domain-containing putative transcriptional regulator [Betaproteobacteria bacterium]|nr:BTAD domain-containing putative transcriptional regulator [Betaproteobacteria bacterium]
MKVQKPHSDLCWAPPALEGSLPLGSLSHDEGAAAGERAGPAPRGVLAIRLLGEMQVSVDGEIRTLRYRHVRLLLAYLVVERRPVRREELGRFFWPHAEGDAANGCLRQALCHLKKWLGPAADYLHATRTAIGLKASAPVWLDIDAMDHAATMCLASDAGEAATLYRGPFLSAESSVGRRWDAWVARQRERVDEKADQVFSAVLQGIIRSKGTHAALLWAMKWAAARPLGEAAHLALMRQFDACGRGAEALAAFDSYTRRLAEATGRKPASALVALRDSLLRGEAARPAPIFWMTRNKPAGKFRPSSEFVAVLAAAPEKPLRSVDAATLQDHLVHCLELARTIAPAYGGLLHVAADGVVEIRFYALPEAAVGRALAAAFALRGGCALHRPIFLGIDCGQMLVDPSEKLAVGLVPQIARVAARQNDQGSGVMLTEAASRLAFGARGSARGEPTAVITVCGSVIPVHWLAAATFRMPPNSCAGSAHWADGKGTHNGCDPEDSARSRKST